MRQADFTEYLRSKVPANWTIEKGPIWTNAVPERRSAPDQGWKIHLSGTPATFLDILNVVAPLLGKAEVEFKILSSKEVVHAVCNKLWPREGFGKLIAVYPKNVEEFRQVGAQLASATKEFDGPYILSDRRWPSSRVVFYRYGGFKHIPLVRYDGIVKSGIRKPDGSLVIDERLPYWCPPDFVSDPIANDSIAQLESKLFSKFRDVRPLSFSSRGGIYRAVEISSGRDVVLREARPFVQVGQSGVDSVKILKKEFELSKALQEHPAFLRSFEIFSDWEHHYLCQPYIEHIRLGHFVVKNNPIYHRKYDCFALEQYLEAARNIWLQLLDAIIFAHSEGIILGDISFTNVMVSEGDHSIKIIDLEASVRAGIDDNVGLFTQGIASRRAMDLGVNDISNDLNCLGSIICGSIAVVNTMIGFNPEILDRVLASFEQDVGISNDLTGLISDLIALDTAEPDYPRIKERLQRANLVKEIPSRMSQPIAARIHDPDVEIAEIRRAVARICSDIILRAETDRFDRLYPADQIVHSTNPLSIAFGAAGTMLAINGVGTVIPEEHLSWLESKIEASPPMPNGLLYGKSGLVWLFTKLGDEEKASRHLMEAASILNERGVSCIGFGQAGFGMSCLHGWLRFGDEHWLALAKKAGEVLASTCIEADGKVYWAGADGTVRVGFAYGQSGIASFLLYLSLATGCKKFLSIGEKALEFDLGYGGYSQGKFSGFPEVASEGETLSCYWESGTAGVLSALLRYQKISPSDEFYRWIELCLDDLDYKYAAYPSFGKGLAGVGNVELDLVEFGFGDGYFGAIERAKSIVLNGVHRDERMHFCGRTGRIVSCDLLSGSAGVMLFLDRLTNAKRNPFFMLDDLLECSG